MSDFPEIKDLWASYQGNPAVKEHLVHNVQILRCIRGGLKMAQTHRIAFDPRAEYWRRPERRLLVAYFASIWGDRMTPVKDVRAFAKIAFAHFEPLHQRPVFQLCEPNFEPTPEAMDQILEILLEECATFLVGPTWQNLRKTWKNLKLPATAGEHLAAFFRKAIPILKKTSGLEGELGIGFGSRLPWFAYLGYQNEEAFAERQAFFFGFANLLTTSNAYVQGGSLVVAPMIQNTPSDALLGPFLGWVDGGHPGAPPLLAFGPNDAEERDCSHYRPIVECYGFLNLERVPYYNQAASIFKEWLGVAKATPPLEVIEAVGERVRAQLQLKENSALVPLLAATFRELYQKPGHTRVWMEWTRPSKAAAHKESFLDLIDSKLIMELQEYSAFDESQTDQAAAACLVHLLLDSRAYKVDKILPAVVVTGDAALVPLVTSMALPETLRDAGELALAVLRAGKHVLLAGAPGTGKTTLAQFIAQSWNEDAACLKAILDGEKPFMTVGNSAWSPFHTIGGMFPDGAGLPKASPGVFVDPGSAGPDGAWSLRSEAVIVDELNRADMDRCIGELYPLLSASVLRIRPAGLPGVNTIDLPGRFRIIATANMSLSDLVFPMSEGLARRFQLIELPGASLEEVSAYLQTQAADEERLQVAIEVVRQFFNVVTETGKLLAKDAKDAGVTPRLRFGVGFFGLLKDWVTGVFVLPEDSLDTAAAGTSMEEAAAKALVHSLSTAALTKELAETLRAFGSPK